MSAPRLNLTDGIYKVYSIRCINDYDHLCKIRAARVGDNADRHARTYYTTDRAIVRRQDWIGGRVIMYQYQPDGGSYVNPVGDITDKEWN